jgi:tetratricopeptide (TPR) repeat protein
MAKQKRLNKNLVAFLTIMGVVLIVAVAALVTRLGTRRDPAVLAAGALERERAGDLGKAADLYQRAYANSEPKDTKYLVDAARRTLQMGDFQAWFGLLQSAAAQRAGDPSLLEAILQGLWRILEICGRLPKGWPEICRDYADKLLQLKPDDVLGLVSQAQALWTLPGEENLAAADEAAKKAFELAPRDPRAALTYLMLNERQTRERVRAGSQAGRAPAELQDIGRKYAEAMLPVLAAADAEHPGNPPLIAAYVGFLEDDAQRSQSGGQTAAAEERMSQADEVLAKALAASPDSAELHLTMARHVLLRLSGRVGGPGSQAADELRAAVEQHTSRAIELEPALYDAYIVRSDAKLLAFDDEGKVVNPPAERFEVALTEYEKAVQDTATLRNLRTRLTPEGRVSLLRRGFSTALGYYALATDEAERKARLARAKALVESAERQYDNHPLTHFSKGEYLVAEGRYRDAILAFQKAHQEADHPVYWSVRVDAAERLALLYQEQRQYGEAAVWADRALTQYAQAGRLPPARLIAARATLYTQLGHPSDPIPPAQKAIDLLEKYKNDYPDDRTLTALRASALAALGRKAESDQLATNVSGTDPAKQLWRARLAAAQQDFAGAEELARAVLDDKAATDVQITDALALYVDVMSKTGQRADARQYIQTLLAKPPRPGMERSLQTCDVLLSEENEQQRDDKLLDIIKQNPDALSRAAGTYQFYALRRDLEQAAAALAEMRKARPDDLRLVEEEFRLALRRKAFDQATGLLLTLSQSEGGRGQDGVGGALFRGELELAQGHGEAAIREFRQAERGLPKSAELQTNLGLAYLVAGRSNEGTEALEQAVAINPNFFEAYRLLMLAYEQLARDSFGPERAALVKSAEDYLKSAEALNKENPDVKSRTQRKKEEDDPLTAIANYEQERAAHPEDATKLSRLGQLYLLAWSQASPPTGDEARQLAERADRFFQEALPTLKGDGQRELARWAATFYAISGESKKGPALLGRVVEEQTGLGRVSAQLLLAGLFGALGDAEAAENGYRQAQRMVPEAVPSAPDRQRAELTVGRAFMDFYEQQRQPMQVVEVCRWLLDRLGSESGVKPASPEGGFDAGPTVQATRLRLIAALLTAGQLGDAESEIGDYRKAYPDDLAGLAAQAQLRLARNQREEAQADLTSILKQDPENIRALINRGALALLRGRYEEARTDLERARTLVVREPQLEPLVRSGLARLYEADNKLDAAIEELRKMLAALDAAGAAPEAKQQVVARLVRVLMRNKEFDRAQALISDYMEKYKDDPIWPLQLGTLLESRGDTATANKSVAAARQNYATAATYYQGGAERSRGKNPARLAAATAATIRVLTKAGQARDAVNVFKGLPAAELAPPVRAAAARAYGALNEPDAAREQWARALLDAAQQGSAQVGAIARDMRSVLSAADAEALLRQVTETAPPDPDAGLRLRTVLAAHLALTGNPAGALPLLDEVLGKAAARGPLRLEALLVRAQALEKLKQSEDAVKTYREILEAYGDNLTALNNVAYLLVTAETPGANRPREALQYAERLRALVANEPGAATMLDTVGWVYFVNGNVPEAAAVLEESLNLDSETNPVAYLHLGQVYAKLGRTADARSKLTFGLELVRRPGVSEETRKYEVEFNEQLGKLP